MNQIPYPYDINTIEVQILNKKLREVPEWIQYLPNLENLDLDYNRISIIPEWLGNMTTLKHLSLANNTISDLPFSLSNLINLQTIRLHLNHFKYIPECISNMINLTSFGMSNNMIESIPESLFENCIHITNLSICNNYLTSIPSNISNLTNLNEIMILTNDIKTLPVSITHLTNISLFYYKHNPYEHIPPLVERFLYRIKNKINHLHVYSDTQSVHTPSIQKSITKSIENIMNQSFDFNIVDHMDKILTEIYEEPCLIKSIQLIKEYVQIDDVHSILQVTFKEMLCYVWETIKRLDNQSEIKSILNCEISESYNKCFTGRISRLINCLNGFTELVSINIDTNEEIGNIITIEQHKLGDLYTIEQHKENVKQQLLERGYTDSIISEWLLFIE
jgi:Leucine-rich repeat (LRR) protein